MYRAVLDTCVLVPGLQRDFLLQLAAEGAFAPVWSSGTLDELDYVLQRIDERHGHTPRPEYRARLFAQMRAVFPGSTIEAPRNRTYTYDLRDRFDGHVAHAAILGKADAIVTNDSHAGLHESASLRDAFVEVLSAADFAANAVAAHKRAGLNAVFELASRRTAPQRTPRQMATQLAERYGMNEVFELLTRETRIARGLAERWNGHPPCARV